LKQGVTPRHWSIQVCHKCAVIEAIAKLLEFAVRHRTSMEVSLAKHSPPKFVRRSLG
jgi:hypothetical protein